MIWAIVFGIIGVVLGAGALWRLASERGAANERDKLRARAEERLEHARVRRAEVSREEHASIDRASEVASTREVTRESVDDLRARLIRARARRHL